MGAEKNRPAIEFLEGEFAIHRFGAGDALPDVAGLQDPWAMVRTEEGLTLVCRADAPGETEPGWSAFRVRGPLDFSLTGVLAGISAVLAEAGISIFAISCWETDYVLVRQDRGEDARQALEAAGYPIVTG